MTYLGSHRVNCDASVSLFIKQVVGSPSRSPEALNSYRAGPQVSPGSTSLGMCRAVSSSPEGGGDEQERGNRCCGVVVTRRELNS